MGGDSRFLGALRVCRHKQLTLLGLLLGCLLPSDPGDPRLRP